MSNPKNMPMLEDQPGPPNPGETQSGGIISIPINCEPRVIGGNRFGTAQLTIEAIREIVRNQMRTERKPAPKAGPGDLEYLLREIATPCAVCGNRPGIWLTALPHRREVLIRFECHNEQDIIAVKDYEVMQAGVLEYARSLVPFARFKKPSLVLLPAKKLNIFTERRITLED